MRYLAIDFETANAERSSICAFGFACFEDGVLRESGVELCRPDPDYYDGWNIRIHGIRPEDTANSPGFGSLLPIFSQYSPDFLVAHNAAFDMSCLRAWCGAHGQPYPDFRYLCTLVASRRLVPGLPSYSLDTLCRMNDIPLNHHEASSDATACGLLLAEALRLTGAGSAEDLCSRLGICLGSLDGDTYIACGCGPRRTGGTGRTTRNGGTGDLERAGGTGRTGGASGQADRRRPGWPGRFDR